MILSHLAIRVHQHYPLAVRSERERRLVTRNALIRKRLEYLLQSGLRHTVLLDAQIAPLLLKLAEKPANGLAFLGHAKFEEFAALLKDFHLLEVPREVGKYAEAVGLCLEELKQVSQAHLTISVDRGLSGQVMTETVFSDLIQDKLVEIGAFALVYGSLEVDFGL